MVIWTRATEARAGLAREGNLLVSTEGGLAAPKDSRRLPDTTRPPTRSASTAMPGRVARVGGPVRLTGQATLYAGRKAWL